MSRAGLLPSPWIVPQDDTVTEYFSRLWKELVALAVATTVVAALVALFVKGGLFLPITAGIAMFLITFPIAHIRAVINLQTEKTEFARQLNALQAEQNRLTSERDEARRERDIAKTALAVVDVTRDVSLTVRIPVHPPPNPPAPPPPAPQLPPADQAPPAQPPELPPPPPEELTPPPDEPNVGDS